MIPNLQDLRKEIDAIDDQITSLFEKRMAIAEQVAQFKIENEKPVFDRSRELEKLKSVSERTHSKFNSCGIQELCPSVENANINCFRNMEHFRKAFSLPWIN